MIALKMCAPIAEQTNRLLLLAELPQDSGQPRQDETKHSRVGTGQKPCPRRLARREHLPQIAVPDIERQSPAPQPPILDGYVLWHSLMHRLYADPEWLRGRRDS